MSCNTSEGVFGSLLYPAARCSVFNLEASIICSFRLIYGQSNFLSLCWLSSTTFGMKSHSGCVTSSVMWRNMAKMSNLLFSEKVDICDVDVKLKSPHLSVFLLLLFVMFDFHWAERRLTLESCFGFHAPWKCLCLSYLAPTCEHTSIFFSFFNWGGSCMWPSVQLTQVWSRNYNLQLRGDFSVRKETSGVSFVRAFEIEIFFIHRFGDLKGKMA